MISEEIDENHNALNLCNQFPVDQVTNGAIGDIHLPMKLYIAHSPKFRSKFEKLKCLHREIPKILSGDFLKEMKKDGVRIIGGEMTSDTPSTQSEVTDEALLYLHINRMFGLDGSNHGGALHLKDLITKLETLKKRKLNSIITVSASVEQEKCTEECRNSTLLALEHSKGNIQKCSSISRAEMESSFEALVDVQRNTIHEIEKEKLNMETEIREVKRENTNLRYKIKSLEAELELVRNEWYGTQTRSKETDQSGLVDEKVKGSCSDSAHLNLLSLKDISENRSEYYKSQLTELKKHSGNMLTCVTKVAMDHRNEITRLQDEISSVEKLILQQRETFIMIIKELTETFDLQVEYTKSVVDYAKQQESQNLQAKEYLSSYIRKMIQQCSSTVACLEKGMRAGQDEKVSLKKVIHDLVDKLEKHDHGLLDHQQNLSRNIPKADINPEDNNVRLRSPYNTHKEKTGTQDDVQVLEILQKEKVGVQPLTPTMMKTPSEIESILNVSCAKITPLSTGLDYCENEYGLETSRLKSRVGQLERLNEDNSEKVQKYQVKYQKLFHKYSKYKQSFDEKCEEAEVLLREIHSLKNEPNPMLHEKLLVLEKMMEKSRVRHIKFEAMLEEIEVSHT